MALRDLRLFPPELLSNAAMALADANAVRRGVPVLNLMERAGRAVADAVPFRAPVAVLCGPGNNGGDGYVAARCLAAEGLDVSVFTDHPPKSGSPAAEMAARARCTAHPLADFRPHAGMIVIDALYGAGLTRAIEGEAAAAIARTSKSGAFIVAVDVPSGLSGDTGLATGPVLPADRTVTFFRTKAGHWLQPGRHLCGTLILAQIGLEAVDMPVDPADLQLWLNGPWLWRSAVPEPGPEVHKFRKGHILAISGPEFRTGAARLAALAALHAGAGLVTVAGNAAALRVHAAHLSAIMLAEIEQRDAEDNDLRALLTKSRFSAALIGPAAGIGPETKRKLAILLEAGLPAVIDADAISALGGLPEWLAARNRAGAVLTPHAGEFIRLFGPDITGSKVETTRAAARRSGCVVVHKGPDTVIAAPDGRAAINTTGGAELATAGSGDVLAGIIAAHLSAGLPPFEAAAAGVFRHAEAGRRLGPGLTADLLAIALPPLRAA
ncbi:NAD(P)H-hydrate dehydratase [Rhabdaerophilum sp. SD176]|uniref:NAD(P)H-hydrate dehydratase n=1 Tax=Rhabdaerophilum sp. SD176 TaxID=2983548 RepID=UPI0024DF8811|nr:NAD(P)H-hydrate dehydratase [Rhabdaerophilum sp. SD176]